ncbi:putative sugar transporter sugar binding protein [Streptomyces sp. Tu6071]|nr:putative sugar transporter sugar binding protein [Streptomyces sp. Tu6071]
MPYRRACREARAGEERGEREPAARAEAAHENGEQERARRARDGRPGPVEALVLALPVGRREQEADLPGLRAEEHLGEHPRGTREQQHEDRRPGVLGARGQREAQAREHEDHSGAAHRARRRGQVRDGCGDRAGPGPWGRAGRHPPSARPVDVERLRDRLRRLPGRLLLVTARQDLRHVGLDRVVRLDPRPAGRIGRGVARLGALGHRGGAGLVGDGAREGRLVGDVVHRLGEVLLPALPGEFGDDLEGGAVVVGAARDDEVGAAGEDGARLGRGLARDREEAQFALELRILLHDQRGRAGHRDDLADPALGEDLGLRRVLLVGRLRALAEGLELGVEVHPGERVGAVDAALPAGARVLGEVAALVPDEAREGVPVLSREVDALVAAPVEQVGVVQPLGAVARGLGDAGLVEELLVVDDDAVGRVPRHAVLRAVEAARLGEAGEPVVHTEVAHRLQRQVVQPALVDVPRHLGVADLDDVGHLDVLAALERLADLLDDAVPRLDLDVDLEVVVLLLEVLGEALEEGGGRAVLHEPHGDGLTVPARARQDPAAAQDGGRGEQRGGGEQAAVLHVGGFLSANRQEGPGVGDACGA